MPPETLLATPALSFGTLVWVVAAAVLLADEESAVGRPPLEVALLGLAVLVDAELLAVAVIMELDGMADELRGVPVDDGAADDDATPEAPATWKRGKKLYSSGLESSMISMV